MSELTKDNIERMRQEATDEVQGILNELENDYPGITEGLSAAVGAGLGGAAAFGALYGLGVTGVSAAGITSGLAAAGSIIGGGMVAGIGVLAAPAALLGVGAYAIVKKRKNARLAAALGTAIGKLYAIQERLLSNAEYFKNEIITIRATIDLLTKKKPA
ncbi:hypothetical protein [Citrobacter werkmanii]|uniref:hypothetical protein n=1 Tax=Citrobacter werkmanii TaxID=67827 RepID=UPI0026533E96|nr:hypothetical protein [Citrobacter werkmanii]MDN8559093.1 hypothetical protein [Citrobacter werkmanii]